MTKEEIIEVLRWEPQKLRSAHETIRSDSEIVRAVVEWEPWAIMYADDGLRDDEEMGLFVVQKMPGTIQYLSEHLQNKPSIIQACLTGPEGYGFLQWVPAAYTEDYEYVLAVMKKVGRDLEWVSEDLKHDKTIVAAAVENDPTRAIGFVPEVLKSDEEFMEELFDRVPEIFPHLSLSSRSDRERVLCALRCNGSFYEVVPSVLKTDHEVIQLALDCDPFAIQWVPERELVEGEYWKRTIPEWPGTFFELPKALQERLDIAKLLVETSYEYYYHLPDELASKLNLPDELASKLGLI